MHLQAKKRRGNYRDFVVYVSLAAFYTLSEVRGRLVENCAAKAISSCFHSNLELSGGRIYV